MMNEGPSEPKAASHSRSHCYLLSIIWRWEIGACVTAVWESDVDGGADLWRLAFRTPRSGSLLQGRPRRGPVPGASS